MPGPGFPRGKSLALAGCSELSVFFSWADPIVTIPITERMATTRILFIHAIDAGQRPFRGPFKKAINRSSFSILDGHEATDVGVAIQEEAEIGHHHFFPALKSLVHPAARIGIVLVASGAEDAVRDVSSFRARNRAGCIERCIRATAADLHLRGNVPSKMVMSKHVPF
jgi:hypothetical protein